MKNDGTRSSSTVFESMFLLESENALSRSSVLAMSRCRVIAFTRAKILPCGVATSLLVLAIWRRRDKECSRSRYNAFSR
jgi:hypothetical protein